MGNSSWTGMDLMNFARETLSEKRFNHSLRTAETARTLAEQFSLDGNAAWQAGVLHDIARELPAQQCMELLEGVGETIQKEGIAHPVLLHGPCGARLAANRFPGLEKTVLEAIRSHTTGFPGMGPVAKALFIADYTEPGRCHIDERFRSAMIGKDLNELCLLVLDHQHAHLKEQGRRIAKSSLLLYDELLAVERGIAVL